MRPRLRPPYLLRSPYLLRPPYLLRTGVGAAALAALVVATTISPADAPGKSYRIGSALSVSKAAKKPAPAPSPSPTPTSATTSPSPTPTTSTTTSAPPSAADCGGGTLLKSDGSKWTCAFDDEFAGTAVDRAKWTVQTTAASGFHSGAECFMDSPNNIAVSNGTLKLIARKESAPFTCTDPSGNYTTQYTSGTVNGYGKFSQTYGMFEVRAKVPSTTVKGLQETLWMWPVNQVKYGLWPASGEIDLAEFYSQYQGWNIPYLHYDVQQSTVSWATNTNVYTALPSPSNQPGMTCTFKPTDFNTYTVLWQPGRITLQVNHQNCIVDNYAASNVAGPAPFDQPFFMALTQALGIGSNAFVAGTTPLPATTEVDYVRIWK
jgi:beta-glucanase (GH16 family)